MASGTEGQGGALPAGVATAAACLESNPQLPFDQRLNIRQVKAGRLGDVLILVLCIAGMHRCGHIFLSMHGWQRTAVFAWQGAAAAGSAAGVLWRRLAPDSFVAHRELPAALMRVVCMGCGLGGLLMTRVLDESPLPAQGGMAGGLEPLLIGLAHSLLLIFASGTLHMLLFFFCWRVRLSLSTAAQLCLLASVLPTNRSICSTKLLSERGMQGRTHGVYLALSCLGHSLPLSPSLFKTLDALGECRTVLSWLQLCCGCLLPLLWEARSTAQLFAAHQRQRQAAGLPPERGAQARALGAISSLFTQDTGISLLALAWLTAALSWEACFFAVLHQ